MNVNGVLLLFTGIVLSANGVDCENEVGCWNIRGKLMSGRD